MLEIEMSDPGSVHQDRSIGKILAKSELELALKKTPTVAKNWPKPGMFPL